MSETSLASRVAAKLRAVAMRGLPSLRNVVFSSVDFWPVRPLGDHWSCSLPVYCISLTRAWRRRAIVARQVARLGLRRFEFVDAVDSSSFTVESAIGDGLYNETESRKWHRNGLTKNEIACSLSHAECYRRIVDAEHPLALVLEDDALFHSGRLKRLERADLPPWADIVFLNSFLATPTPRDRISARVFADTSYNGSGAAYIVTQHAAKRLLAEAIPVIHAADGLLGRALAWDGPSDHPFRQQGSELRFRGAIVHPDIVINGSVEHYYRTSIRT